MRSVYKTSVVNLEDKNIKKIEGLERASVYIKELLLCDNNIETIQGLNSCKNLVFLDLGDNKISRIEKGAFNGLNNLKELNLFGNKIEKIENLEPLTNLEGLILSGNKIQKIENISHLNKLERLFLAGN